MLRTEFKDDRSTLSVGHPMRADRCGRGKQFFEDDVAVETGPAAAAVFGRQRHPNPSLCAEASAEFRREAGEQKAFRIGISLVSGNFTEKCADLLPKSFMLFAKLGDLETGQG